MRLLPKKQDIDKAVAQERKRDIDAGVSLATKLDELRRAKVKEEQDLFAWRDNTIKTIQYDIGQYLEEKENLKKQNDEARQIRDALLKPDIIQVKAELSNMVNNELAKRNIYLSGETLKAEEKKLRDDKEKIKQIVIKLKKDQDDTEKTKQSANSLNELATREYELARAERESQSEAHEKAMSEARGLKDEYENGIKVYEIHEKEVKEKESELLIREKHLASQQLALKIAMEEFKKYASDTIDTER